MVTRTREERFDKIFKVFLTIDNYILLNRHKKIDQKYPILIGTIPLFSSPWTPWTQINDTRPTAPTSDQEPSVSNPMPVPIPGFVQPSVKVTNLPEIPRPDFNEYQSPNQPIGWDMRESRKSLNFRTNF